MSVSVTNLSKSYGAQKAIDSLSFAIKKGEIVGFLGPNGAGKSTTMKILSGYLPAGSGTARICGYDVSKAPLEVKRRLGYLPESNPLYPEMYVKEMLSFTAGLYGIPHKQKRIKDIIALTGLEKECHKKIGALSKGYKQRVGLARVLLPDPEVLILDEPTSGLDPNQLAEIRSVIRELGHQKTVMLSTHIMQEVKAICERVIIIHQGKIVADDAISRLEGQNNQATLTVAFEEIVNKELLLRLAGVKNLSQDSPLSWSIVTDVPEAVKKSLWQLALQNNLNIVSLQSNTASLEALFHKLTK